MKNENVREEKAVELIKTEDERKPVEVILGEAKTPDWLFAAAKAHQKWALGQYLTRAEYDAAVKKVGGLTFSANSK